MEDGMARRSGERNPVRPVAVWIDATGGVGVADGIVVSGVCPCFSTGVWGGVGGGCLGCVHGS